jgi:hypothetical protein
MTTRLLILGLTLLVLASGALAAQIWDVTLRDGRTVEGSLVRLEQGRYLLQTEDRLYELSDDDIAPVTFSVHPRREAAPERPIVQDRQYVELAADGSETLHWMHHFTNDSPRAITEYRFGLAPWEQRTIDRRQLHDDFGRPLTLSFDPPRSEWQPGWDRRVKAAARLPVPVAPGETWSVGGRQTHPDVVVPTEQGLRYRHAGNYPEYRLVWRKVRLPRGASVVSVSPEPTARFEHDDFTYVMWRQFFREGEERFLDVIYTLD